MGYDRLVTVDNTNTQFRWVGPWFRTEGNVDEWGAAGPPFLGTLQGITSDGGLYFTFRGTDVMLWGSIRVANAGNSSERDPDWDCYVDGQKLAFIDYYPNDQFSNFLMCEDKALPEGEHTLQLMARVQRSTLWVDSVQYAAASDLDISGLWTEVQQGDGRFTYSEGWVTYPEMFTRLTYTTGASVTYEFDGEAIIWGGQNPRSNSSKEGSASWSIDGEPPRSFTIPATNVSMFNQQYFNRTDLKAGKHRLQVTNKGDSSTAPLAFSFVYTKNSSKANKSKLIGGAIGGAIGGIILVSVLVWVIFKRRRRRQNQSEPVPSMNPAQTSVDGGPTVLEGVVAHESVHKSEMQTRPGPSISQQPHVVRNHSSPQTPPSSYLVDSHTSTSTPLLSQSYMSQSDTALTPDPRFYPSSLSAASISGSPPPYQNELPVISEPQADAGTMTYFPTRSKQ